MVTILVNDANPETKSLLVEYLVAAGFEVLSTENGLVSVQLAHEKFSTAIETKKSNTSQSIFPSNSRLHEVFKFIELNYHQSISLKEVAKAVGYSPAYLTDLVKKLTGKTVNRWIIECRIVQAGSLLLGTNYSINEIAVTVGYQNINHFYRQFRDYYNHTPRTWREIRRCKVA